jgi:hypothetical protein
MLAQDGCHVYCLTDDDRLVYLDAESGEIDGELELPKGIQSFCMNTSGRKLLAAGDEGLYAIDPKPLFNPTMQPEAPLSLSKSHIPNAERWISEDGCKFFMSTYDKFTIFDFASGTTEALELGGIHHFSERSEPGGYSVAAFIDGKGELGVFTDDRRNNEPVRVFRSGFRYSKHRLMGICHLDSHLLVFYEGSDDQITRVDAIVWNASQFTKIGTASVYGEDRLRRIKAVIPLGTGILIASMKRMYGGLYFWPEPIADIQMESRLRKVNILGKYLSDISGESQLPGMWNKYLRTTDPRRIYIWNAGSMDIACLEVTREGRIRGSKLADKIPVTTWHLKDDYVCVFSNLLDAVYLIDTRTSRVSLIEKGVDIQMARIKGNDAQTIEVYIHDKSKARIFKRSS